LADTKLYDGEFSSVMLDFIRFWGLSISSAIRSIFGKNKCWFNDYGLNLSSLIWILFYPWLINSFLRVFLKFLKDTITAVILSRVLLATAAFRTSSTLYPHIEWIDWVDYLKFLLAASHDASMTSLLLSLSKTPSPKENLSILRIIYMLIRWSHNLAKL